MWKIAAFAALLAGVATAARAECRLAKLADLPLEIIGEQAVVPSKLRGQPIRLLVDTGAWRTMFDLDLAKQAGLPIEDAPYRVMGVGGEVRAQQATFDDLEIGGMKLQTKRLLVIAGGFRGIAGVLGFDFFGKIDVELNFRSGEMRLFQPVGCGDENLAYWAPEKADSVEMLANRNWIEIPVLINGTRFRAALDTGAWTTVAGQKVADFFGIKPSASGGSIYGVDNRRLDVASSKFDNFQIGEEIIRNPTLRVATGMSTGFSETGTRLANRQDEVDLLLGFDFMRSHRIFIANSQRRVYFTYEGGTVFPLLQDATAK